MPSHELLGDEAVARFISDGFLFLDISKSTQVRTQKAFEVGLPFFRSALEEKMKAVLPRDSGYRPTGIEYSRSADHPDEVESFTASRRFPVDRESLPLSAQALHECMLVLYDLLEPVAETFAIAIGNRFDQARKSHLWKDAFRQFSFLQMNYSRPLETQGDCINDLHEDGCLFTIMSVTADGLELQAADRSFHAVRPDDRSLLIIAGEIMWLLTGKIISPIYHRVRPIASIRERMSLLFFADLDPQLCTPWIFNEINRNIDM